MKLDFNQMNRIKSNQAYKVPEGYFENLPGQIMSRLPEESTGKTTSLFQRVRPWLYAAAISIGLMFAYTIFTDKDSEDGAGSEHSRLMVRSNSYTSSSHSPKIESEEYLEYIENVYTNDILSDELNNME